MKSQPAYQKYSETSIEVVSSALTFSVVGSSTSRCSGNEPALHPFPGRTERAVKIEPICGLYFSKALFEGLIFGGAYVRREICVSKSIEQACSGREIYHFLLCLTLYLRANSNYKPPRGLYSEGRFNGGFFALRFWGAYTWRGLFSEFYGIPSLQIL